MIQMQNLYIETKDHFTLHCCKWTEDAIETDQRKGILHIVHGFGEFAACYEKMARYFAENGYITVVMELRGHGESGRIPGEASAFLNAPLSVLTDDIGAVCQSLKKEYPSLPYYLMGISVGTFLVKNYMLQDYCIKLDGVIMGSTNALPLPILRIFQLAYGLDGMFGRRKKITGLSEFFFYHLPQTKIPSRYTVVDWIYADHKIAKDYVENPKAILHATNHNIQVLVEAMLATRKMKRSNRTKNTAALFIFGSDDPMTGTKRSIDQTVKVFENADFPRVDVLEYEKKRHGVLLDRDCELVWEDLLEWLESQEDLYQ